MTDPILMGLCPQCRRLISYRKTADGKRFFLHKTVAGYFCPEGRRLDR